MGHREFTDTCGMCGTGYNSHEEPWAQYNWEIAKTPLCPDCSQKIQWPNIPIFKVTLFATSTGTTLHEMIVFREEKAQMYEEKKGAEVSIIAPPMRFTR